MNLLNEIDIQGISNVRKGAFIVNCKDPKGSSKIAAFDLDHTLIKPNKGRWPKSWDDWKLINDRVKPRLQELHKDGYKIVVFTNQGGKFEAKSFARKVRAISTEIGVPMQVYGCTEHGYCRKPSIGMWRLLTRMNDKIEIDLEESFYVGDAYPGAFSDSDYKFALNIGIDFYTPEEYFVEKPVVYEGEIPEHPVKKLVNRDTFTMLALDACPPFPPISEVQELIIMVGPPACGKSTHRNQDHFKDYVVACQDDLGTKAKVIKLVRKSLSSGKSVILDRKNEYIKYRKEFIDIANEYKVPVRVFWFEISKELARHMSAYREIMTDKHIPNIVFNKFFSETKGMEPPTVEEGVESVTKIDYIYDEDMLENLAIVNSYLIG